MTIPILQKVFHFENNRAEKSIVTVLNGRFAL